MKCTERNGILNHRRNEVIMTTYLPTCQTN